MQNRLFTQNNNIEKINTMTFQNEKVGKNSEAYYSIFNMTPSPKKRLRKSDIKPEVTPRGSSHKRLKRDSHSCNSCSNEYPSEAHLRYHTWNNHTV